MTMGQLHSSVGERTTERCYPLDRFLKPAERRASKILYRKDQFSSACFFVVICVDFCVVLPFFRHVGIGENRLDRTSRYTRTAINTDFGIDIELRIAFVSMNAINWANVNARLIFCSDAWFRDDVRHNIELL
jgi:hypothetical protein